MDCPEQPSEEGSVKNYLLSIFPLRNFGAYARISCMPLLDSPVPWCEPMLKARGEVVTMIRKMLPVTEQDLTICQLDEGSVVQIPIDDEEARAIGFFAHLN